GVAAEGTARSLAGTHLGVETKHEGAAVALNRHSARSGLFAEVLGQRHVLVGVVAGLDREGERRRCGRERARGHGSGRAALRLGKSRTERDREEREEEQETEEHGAVLSGLGTGALICDDPIPYTPRPRRRLFGLITILTRAAAFAI